MSRLMLKICLDKFKSLPRDENGAAMMITLAVVLFLYLMCSASYAIGMTVNEKIQLQNACDAAAYSAAVVEADCLSRIATINRAMSWTYIQTVRRRMDYIVLEWLNLTAKRFEEDRDMCRNFNADTAGFIWHADFFLGLHHGFEWVTCLPGEEGKITYTKINCPHTGSAEPKSGTWWCGWLPDDDKANDNDGQIRLGYLTKDEDQNQNREDFQYGRFLKYSDIKKQLLADYDRLRKVLRDMIDNDDKTLATLSLLQENCIRSMSEMTKTAIGQVLCDNLPANSGFGDDEYFFRIELPGFNYPYADLESDEAGGKTALWDGIFSASRNTEEDELGFLAASLNMDQASSEIFTKGFLYQDIFGDGIDQWFIRGSEDTLKKTDEHFRATTDDYAMRGIQRGYKSANREEAAEVTQELRGNHVAYGNSMSAAAGILSWPASSQPMLFLNFIPIGNGFSAAAQKYADAPIEDIIPSPLNSPEWFPEQCKKTKKNWGLVAEYHWSSMKWWCAKRWKWYKIWKWWEEPDEIGEVHYKAYPISSCQSHGEGGLSSYKRGDYRSCFVGKDMIETDKHNSTNHFPGSMTMGYSRIYGDDQEIYDSTYYNTPKVMPVKLNHNFFQKRISVVVGKTQKNPLRWLFSGSDGYSTAAPAKSIYALFDPMGGGTKTMIMAATSSATAAFRSRRVPTNEKEHYETNYDQISSFEYDGNIEMDTPTIKLSSTLSNAAELRIGCPHEKTENRIAERLKKVWNLCETDWQAVFVPQYYTDESWIGRRAMSLSCDSVADVNADIYYFPYPLDPNDPYSNIMYRLDDLLPLYGGTASGSCYQTEYIKYYLLKNKRQ